MIFLIKTNSKFVPQGVSLKSNCTTELQAPVKNNTPKDNLKTGHARREKQSPTVPHFDELLGTT